MRISARTVMVGLVAALVLAPVAPGPAVQAHAHVTRAPAGGDGIWHPGPGLRWQYQLTSNDRYAATGGINVELCVPNAAGTRVCPDVFDFDLYLSPDLAGGRTDVPNKVAVDAVHAKGARAICYIDAGAIEKDRPDAGRFTAWENDPAHLGRKGKLVGGPVDGYADERWLNIDNELGQRDFVVSVMAARMDACVAAGFDGIEFDLVESYEHPTSETTFVTSADAQLAFNRALAAAARDRGLAAGLKNDVQQAGELVDAFDFAVNESCLIQKECGELVDSFGAVGKAVFHVEYDEEWRKGAGTICAKSAALRFATIRKKSSETLSDLPYIPCV
ncbi:endo alpha-1,4 polygalactosaminidase [Longispora sp. NPDC051575]|uniref:endo alpha-1,4 polygalactosaminidase n=1 Tax=Longispora sp. NPDC051575 TaxID=3154943 RepID=UPI0034138096